MIFLFLQLIAALPQNPTNNNTRVRPINQDIFMKASDPFGVGATLEGYPKYDEIPNAYECSRRCSFIKSCATFTFKKKDPNDPNDHHICWLKPIGTTWSIDGICRAKTGRLICESWVKKAATLPPQQSTDGFGDSTS